MTTVDNTPPDSAWVRRQILEMKEATLRGAIMSKALATPLATWCEILCGTPPDAIRLTVSYWSQAELGMPTPGEFMEVCDRYTLSEVADQINHVTIEGEL